MKEWKKATVKPGETAKVMFTALLTNNDNAAECVSFGASNNFLSDEKAKLIQEKCVEILDIMSEDGEHNG